MPTPKAQWTRGVSYLASEEQRKRIDAFVDPEKSVSLGDVMRELVDLGLAVREQKN